MKLTVLCSDVVCCVLRGGGWVGSRICPALYIFPIPFFSSACARAHRKGGEVVWRRTLAPEHRNGWPGC